ncbi:hypothetical protein MMC28_003207 [Mycoblastus sanguinarius]|nr:hypothetical protein [Mycoblastus sanguinarius]
MSSSPSHPRHAYIEEFNEDAQTTVPETRQTANSAAKRSKPDVVNSKPTRDEFSDSGYSSHTAPTLGSGDSSLESKTGSNPLRVAANTAASKRKPPGVEIKPQSRSQSPEKTLLRIKGSKRQEEEVMRSKSCRCSDCVGEARRSAAPSRSVPPSNKNTAKSPPKVKTPAPPPPPEARPPPAPMAQAVPILQPARPRPRASTSHSYQRPRPISFHGGPMPDPVYLAQQPIYIERQPQSSYPAAVPLPPPSYPPQQHSYFPPIQAAPSPQDFYMPQIPYEPPPQPRPRHRQLVSDNPSARPQSMFYGTSPVVEYGQQPIYTTVAPPARPPSRQPSYPERAPPTPTEYTIRDEDYYRMPPPPPPKVSRSSRQEQRPVVKHANTMSDDVQALRHRHSGREASTEGHVGHRNPVKKSSGERERSRRPSLARPGKTSDEKVTSTRSIERDMARMNIESNTSKQRRRVSVYGHESVRDLQGSVAAVEAYQASKGNVPAASQTPFPAGSLVRRKTHTSNSDTSSRKSGKSATSGKSRTSRNGSDVKPRSSMDRRPGSDTKSRNDNDGISMRFNAAQDVNVDLKGGVEGRTISLRPNKESEGGVELSIGSRGRTVGSRTVVSRPESREKSRKRYSYADGRGSVTEIERARTTRHVPQNIKEEDEPRVIAERITTTSRSRRRSGSRSGYSGRTVTERDWE